MTIQDQLLKTRAERDELRARIDKVLALRTSNESVSAIQAMLAPKKEPRYRVAADDRDRVTVYEETESYGSHHVIATFYDDDHMRHAREFCDLLNRESEESHE